MKTITFTVEIQADYAKGSQNPKAVALKLCDEINTILTHYQGETGGAQIMCAPRKITLTNTPDD